MGIKTINNKCGTTYKAEFRRKGFKTKYATFDKKRDAVAWLSRLETEMRQGTYFDRDSNPFTLGEAITRYGNEVTPAKKGARQEYSKLRMLSASNLADIPIVKIESHHVAGFRNELKKQGKAASTIVKYLALLHNIFEIARKEWQGFKGLPNPVKDVEKPKINNTRDRIYEDGEFEAILEFCEPNLMAFILIALETGMRRSEIVQLRRSKIKNGKFKLSDSKNGRPRTIVFTNKAIDVIESMPSETDVLFPHHPDYYTHGFKKAARKAGIEDIKLHDNRHNFCTNAALKGISILHLKSLTGHKTTSQLERYSHIRPESVIDLLNED